MNKPEIINPDSKPTLKRKLTDFLPKNQKSEIVESFFSNTINHAFQPENVEEINGYIGEKFNIGTKKDYYVGENTKKRNFYQLKPVLVNSENNNISNVLFYEDLINGLRFNGAIVNDEARLFDNNFYSWCPPIDLDKLINFKEYYWLPNGYKPYVVENYTNVMKDIAGKQYADLLLKINGWDNVPWDNEKWQDENGELLKVKLSSGMRFIFNNDDTLEPEKIYVIEGVGREIRIIEDDLYSYGWDTTKYSTNYWDDVDIVSKPDYITMERGSIDKNPWSKRNRWFHKDVIIDIDNIEKIKATRPIIEFETDIELYNFGKNPRPSVDLIIDNIPDAYNILNGLSNGWDNFVWDSNELLEKYNIKSTLSLFESPGWEGKNVGVSEIYIKDKQLFDGMRILITSDLNSFYNNKVYKISGIQEDNKIILSLELDGTDDGSPRKDDIIPVRFTNGLFEEYYIFDGINWIKGQQKTDYSQPILFNLYDINENLLNNESLYPNNNFFGNKIFSYQISETSKVDDILGFRPSYNENGEFIFDNNIVIDNYTYENENIKGFKFYKKLNKDLSKEKYENSWYKSELDYTTQRYVQEWTIKDNNNIFSLGVLPELPIIDYNLTENVKVYVEATLPNSETKVLNYGTDYTIEYNWLIINEELNLPNETIIKAKSLGKKINGKNSYVIQKFDYQNSNSFMLSVSPITPINSKNILVLLNDDILEYDVEYTLTDNFKRLIINSPLTNTDIITVRILVKTNETQFVEGFYEIPKALEQNPKNLDVENISLNNFYKHFITIISKQENFNGHINGKNNYRDTPKNKKLGNEIIQNFYPLLKTMTLTSNEDINYIKSLRYIQKEYVKFKNKFIKVCFEYLNGGILNENDPLEIWFQEVLEEVNKGKNFEMAFSNSKVVQDNSYIPATPSWLGITQLYKPEILIDDTFVYKVNVMRNHDGSYTTLFENFIDNVLFYLENKIYESSLDNFKNDYKPSMELLKYKPGKYRKTEYSLNEWNLLLQPSFEKWVIENRVNYIKNIYFDPTEPKTYNYSEFIDIDGVNLPGNWKGIFDYYYDTDRPHLCPWEMLGFSKKPSWFDDTYGPAPYTSGNEVLWNDIENGIIANGIYKGQYDHLKRPGLANVLPVDRAGNLLNPIDIGIPIDQGFSSQITRSEFETGLYGKNEWKFGDISPIEDAWRRSENYSFVLCEVLFNIKSNKFIESNWDTENNVIINDQIINKNSGSRNTDNDYVHGEIVNNNVIYRYGIQQWVSDYLKMQGRDVTRFLGNIIRNQNTKIGHKLGGYVNKSNTKLFADTFGLLPSEDVNLITYNSQSVKEFVYSGVIILWNGNSWKIYGYNNIDPFFNTIPSDVNGRKTSVAIGSRKLRVNNWGENTDYNLGDIVLFNQSYWKAKVSHTSSTDFDASKWSTIKEPETIPDIQVIKYLDGNINNKLIRVPYGTEFRTQQDVFSFLIDYERYLKSEGFIFDEYDETISDFKDWTYCGKQFLIWTLGFLQEGNFISLSPFNNLLKFNNTIGHIQPVEQIINGVYSLLNRDGSQISPQNTIVNRNENIFTIKPSNNDVNNQLFAARFYITLYEHILVINNETIFNDVIYNSLFNERLTRLKISSIRTKNWVGKYEAPGYIISNNDIIPNFEKNTADISKYFDIDDQVNIETLKNYANHNIGFQVRDYLTELQVLNKSQIKLYQGMIRKKGTKEAFEAILRSEFISNIANFDFFDEWAFKIGEYGATDTRPSIEILFKQSEIKQNPQLIVFNKQQFSSWDFFPWESQVFDIDEEYAKNNISSNEWNTLVDNNFIDDKFDDVLTINTIFSSQFNFENLSRIKQLSKKYNHLFKTISERNEAFLNNKIQINDTILIEEDLNVYKCINNAPTFQIIDTVKKETSTVTIDLTVNTIVDRDNLIINDNIKLNENVAVRQTNEVYKLVDISPITYNKVGDLWYTLKLIDEDIVVDIKSDNIISGDSRWLRKPNSTQDNYNNFIWPYRENKFTYNRNNIGWDVVNFDEGVFDNSFRSEFSKEIIKSDLPNAGYVNINDYKFSVFNKSDIPVLYDRLLSRGAYLREKDTIWVYNMSAFGTKYPFQWSILRVSPVDFKFIESNAYSNKNLSSPVRITTDIKHDLVKGDYIVLNSFNQEQLGRGVFEVVEILNNNNFVINYSTYFTQFIEFDNNNSPEIFVLKEIRFENLNEFNNFQNIIKKSKNDYIDSNEKFYIDDGRLQDEKTRLINPYWLIIKSDNVKSKWDENPTKDININGYEENEEWEILNSSLINNYNTTNINDIINLRKAPLFKNYTFEKIFNLLNVYMPITLDTPRRIKSDEAKINVLSNTFELESYVNRYFKKYFTNTFNVSYGTSETNGWNTQKVNVCDYFKENIINVKNENYICETINVGWDYTDNYYLSSYIENEKIDSLKIKNAVIYNKKENRIEVELQLYDPYKGLIPGIAEKEIEFKLDYDPAKYTSGNTSLHSIDLNQAWGPEQVGYVWWDLRTIRYLDYEIQDLEYRRQNWGKFAPGSQIDIYEWIRSDLSPASYQNASNNVNLEIFDEKQPTGEIYLPQSPGWVERTEFDSNTGTFKTFYYYWVKNRVQKPNLDFRKLSTRQIANIITNPTNEGINWFAIIDKNSVIVSNVYQFLNEDTVLQINWKSNDDENNIHREFIYGRENDENWIPDNYLWDKLIDSTVGFDKTNKSVPDPVLTEVEKYGIQIRPRQSMFVNKIEARKNLILNINNILKTYYLNNINNNWEDIFNKEDAPPNNLLTFDTFEERDFAYQNGLININDLVLVNANDKSSNMWTVWLLSDNKPTWILKNAQKYRLRDFWDFETYYRDDIDPTKKPYKNYRRIQDIQRQIELGLILEKEIVQLTLSSGIEWIEFTGYNNNSIILTTVSKEFGTLKLNDKFIKNNTVYGIDTVYENLNLNDFNKLVSKRDGTLELRILMNEIKNILKNIEINKIWFNMVHYAHSEQKVIDWAFKTSYLYLLGSGEKLQQRSTIIPDITDNFLQYIIETKPYHTKIRDYSRRLNADVDVSNWYVTDFDNPPYPVIENGVIENYKILDENNENDLNILQNNKPWKDWYNNKNSDLIRKISINLKFDRIHCDITDIGPEKFLIISDGKTKRWELVSDDNIRLTSPDNINGYICNDLWIQENINSVKIKNNNDAEEYDLLNWSITKENNLIFTVSEIIPEGHIIEISRETYVKDRIEKYYEPNAKLWNGKNLSEVNPSKDSVIYGCDSTILNVKGGTYSETENGWNMLEWNQDLWNSNRPNKDLISKLFMLKNNLLTYIWDTPYGWDNTEWNGKPIPDVYNLNLPLWLSDNIIDNIIKSGNTNDAVYKSFKGTGLISHFDTGINLENKKIKVWVNNILCDNKYFSYEISGTVVLFDNPPPSFDNNTYNNSNLIHDNTIWSNLIWDEGGWDYASYARKNITVMIAEKDSYDYELKPWEINFKSPKTNEFYGRNRPEELVLVDVQEPIFFTIYNKPQEGTPIISKNKLKGRNKKGPYNLPSTPQSNESVFVHVNGQLYLQKNIFDSLNKNITNNDTWNFYDWNLTPWNASSEFIDETKTYSINLQNNTITFNSKIKNNDEILITSWSTGGSIHKTYYFKGGNRYYTLPTNNSNILVIINGNHVNYSLNDNILDLLNETSENDIITVSLFENNISVVRTEVFTNDNSIGGLNIDTPTYGYNLSTQWNETNWGEIWNDYSISETTSDNEWNSSPINTNPWNTNSFSNIIKKATSFNLNYNSSPVFPDWANTIVYKNNYRLKSPNTNYFVSNGISTVYELNQIPENPITVGVWVDGEKSMFYLQSELHGLRQSKLKSFNLWDFGLWDSNYFNNFDNTWSPENELFIDVHALNIHGDTFLTETIKIQDKDNDGMISINDFVDSLNESTKIKLFGFETYFDGNSIVVYSKSNVRFRIHDTGGVSVASAFFGTENPEISSTNGFDNFNYYSAWDINNFEETPWEVIYEKLNIILFVNHDPIIVNIKDYNSDGIITKYDIIQSINDNKLLKERNVFADLFEDNIKIYMKGTGYLQIKDGDESNLVTKFFGKWMSSYGCNLETKYTNKLIISNGLVEILNEWDINNFDYYNFESTILDNPLAKDKKIVVGIFENHQYEIENNVLKILDNLVDNDIITIVTNNDNSYSNMKTTIYKGDILGRYKLNEKVNENYLWVSLNGIKMVNNKDYVITKYKEIFDNTTFDENYDEFELETYYIEFNKKHKEDDEIIITTIAGKEYKPAVAFKIYRNPFGKYDYVRISDKNKTILNSLNENEIVLTENSNILPAERLQNVLSYPDTKNNIPGKILINNEIINYWNIEETIENDLRKFTLTNIERGINGSMFGYTTERVVKNYKIINNEQEFLIPEISTYDKIIVQYLSSKPYDSRWEEPNINWEEIKWDDELVIEYGDKILYSNEYEIINNKIKINFLPENGYTIRIIVIKSDFTTKQLKNNSHEIINSNYKPVFYDSGTVVIDYNKNQHIPGGYEWIWNINDPNIDLESYNSNKLMYNNGIINFGLQNNNDILSKFLLLRTGTDNG